MTEQQKQYVANFWGTRLDASTEKVKLFKKSLIGIITRKEVKAICCNPTPSSTLEFALEEVGDAKLLSTEPAETIMNEDGTVSIWDNGDWTRKKV